MYFLIAGWGYENRVYAATKFFLYTMLGSAFMLVGLIATVAIARDDLGYTTFDLVEIAEGPTSRRRRTLAVLRVRHRVRGEGAARSRCTRGCPTPTPRHRPPARSCWPV
jgi:hypothetical protein